MSGEKKRVTWNDQYDLRLAYKQLWLKIVESVKAPSYEQKIVVGVLSFILVFSFCNYYSNGHLIQRYYQESEIHHKSCMAHPNWSPQRGICQIISWTIFPLVVLPTLLMILILEYLLGGFFMGLKFMCGKWCIAK